MGKKKNKRNDFLALIDNDVRSILDLGCSDGTLSSGFKDKGVEVVGLELSQPLFKEAEKKLSRVFLCNVEEFIPPYPERYFGCILYADILEHLRDPSAILRKYKHFLRDDGFIVASIPNVRYYKLILKLLFSGVWDYMDSGILDRSHLRFFTIVNMKELISEAGYEIIAIEHNIVASRWARFINFLFLNSLKDFLTYQYYIKAKKTPEGVLVINKRKRSKF